MTKNNLFNNTERVPSVSYLELQFVGVCSEGYDHRLWFPHHRNTTNLRRLGTNVRGRVKDLSRRLGQP